VPRCGRGRGRQEPDPASITPATLSEAIAKYVAGAIYFPVLTVLDGTATNTNHQARADFARLGRLRAIVTPNFDPLIERAFREREIPLAEPAPDRDPAHGCTLTVARTGCDGGRRRRRRRAEGRPDHKGSACEPHATVVRQARHICGQSRCACDC